MSVGRVEGLFIAARAGDPMVARTIVLAERGRGLRGDRYALGEGSFSKKQNKVRQISLISAEAIATANEQLEEENRYTYEQTRRNIITTGINLEAILESQSRILKVGSALLEITDDCAPCYIPDTLAGKTGFKTAFADRGGVRARVLESGLIQVRDEIIRIH